MTALHVIRNEAGELWCEVNGWGMEGDIYDLTASLPEGGSFQRVQCQAYAFCTHDADSLEEHPIRKVVVPVCVTCRENLHG